jgi:hypothetical protein
MDATDDDGGDGCGDGGGDITAPAATSVVPTARAARIARRESMSFVPRASDGVAMEVTLNCSKMGIC